MSINLEEYGERTVCYECVSDLYLAKQIENSGKEQHCFYCNDDELYTWPLYEVAQCVEAAFEAHYKRTSDEPNALQSMMQRDKESSYDFEREGDPTIWAIQGALGCSEALADDLQKYLEEKHSDRDASMVGYETEFDSEAHYEDIMPSDGDWHRDWYRFEKELKSETRFFNKSAHDYLTSIFGGIDKMKTSSGQSVIVVGGPKPESEGENAPKMTGFYRARVFYSDRKLEEGMKRPDLELGPPPSQHAKAGRMNAYGVSVFYGSDSADGALAEVRPPVGSQTLMGRFDLLRPVRLLDFSALRSVSEAGSIFDPQYAERLSRARFLRSMKDRINRPVMPTDEEFEYLATQAVIDFLANGLPVELDGVLFPSMQTNEATVNVVLFHRASKVEKLDLPEGTEIGASTYMSTNEGHDPWYSVHEEVLSEEEQAKIEKEAEKYPGLKNYVHGNMVSDEDTTLRLDMSTLQVMMITEANYVTDDHKVHRHRSGKLKHIPF